MKRSIIFVIIIILLFIFIFLLKGENIFFTVLGPLEKFFYGAQNQGSNTNDIYRESAQLKIYRSENEILKKHLNFLENTKDNFILANVIGKKFDSGSDWFILDKGKQHGLVPKMAVVDENGAIIGTLIKVKDSISFLQPIFDRHSLISADILQKIDSDGSNIVSGIVQGEYGLTVKMKYIPADKKINISDTVITSGLQQTIRRGIIIGSVSKVDKWPNAIFQEIIIRPLFNPNFRIVSILLPK